MEHGLLVNFGSYRFQIKKYAMTSGSGDKRGGSGNFLSSFLFAPVPLRQTSLVVPSPTALAKAGQPDLT